MHSSLGLLVLFGVNVDALFLIVAYRAILHPIVISDGWEFRHRGLLELT